MYPVPHCMYLFERGNRPPLAGVPGMAQVARNAISLSVDSAWCGVAWWHSQFIAAVAFKAPVCPGRAPRRPPAASLGF